MKLMVLILLRALLSIHILHSFLFGTNKVGTGQGLKDSLIRPLFKSSSTTCFRLSSLSFLGRIHSLGRPLFGSTDPGPGMRSILSCLSLGLKQQEFQEEGHAPISLAMG